jgi:hypothetical protein
MFAKPYNLYECQLMIFATSGYYDPLVIRNTWSSLLQESEFTIY